MHCNGNVAISTKFSSLVAASDENFVKNEDMSVSVGNQSAVWTQITLLSIQTYRSFWHLVNELSYLYCRCFDVDFKLNISMNEQSSIEEKNGTGGKTASTIMCVCVLAHMSPDLKWVYTLRPRKNGTIWQTIFSNAFSWMRMYEFRLIFHWSLFLSV